MTNTTFISSLDRDILINVSIERNRINNKKEKCVKADFDFKDLYLFIFAFAMIIRYSA